MRVVAIALILALLPGCVASVDYNSDGPQVTGRPCKVLVEGEWVTIKNLELECRGSRPAAAAGALPIALPAAERAP